MPKPLPPQKPPRTRRDNILLALRMVAWGCVLAGMAWGGKQVQTFLVRDPRFSLSCGGGPANCASLEIRGSVYANRTRIQNVFASDWGRSIFRIPLAERRRHLLAVDWVSTASVLRLWPDKLVVNITERRPAAFAKLRGPAGGYRMALIDGDGVLLSIPPRSRFRLPVLSGVSEDQPEEDRKARVEAMRHLLSDLGEEARSVSEINAANMQDLRLVAALDGRAVELWIGDQHFRSRFTNFLHHYGEIRKHFDEATVFDLRLDDRISAK